MPMIYFLCSGLRPLLARSLARAISSFSVNRPPPGPPRRWKQQISELGTAAAAAASAVRAASEEGPEEEGPCMCMPGDSR